MGPRAHSRRYSSVGSRVSPWNHAARPGWPAPKWPSGGHTETGRSDVLWRSARSRRGAAPAGPAGVAVRARRRTIAIVAEWWSIEVLHGGVSAFRWQEQHDSALIEAALTNGVRDGAWHADRWGVVFEVLFGTAGSGDRYPVTAAGRAI